MYLIFDTETTGLPLFWDAPMGDTRNWPRMVQLGYLVYDKNGQLIDQQNILIKPDGYSIPEEATQYHHITNDRALHEGVEATEALHTFNNYLREVDFMIGHNVTYNINIVGTEMMRYNIPATALRETEQICTMKRTSGFCKIPGDFGYKWPTLSQLYEKVFGKKLPKSNDIFEDLKATSQCYWQLKELGIL